MGWGGRGGNGGVLLLAIGFGMAKIFCCEND